MQPAWWAETPDTVTDNLSVVSDGAHPTTRCHPPKADRPLLIESAGLSAFGLRRRARCAGRRGRLPPQPPGSRPLAADGGRCRLREGVRRCSPDDRHRGRHLRAGPPVTDRSGAAHRGPSLHTVALPGSPVWEHGPGLAEAVVARAVVLARYAGTDVSSSPSCPRALTDGPCA